MPDELLSTILKYLDNQDLLNMLLVDRAFCQLARSVLFRDLTFDYSPKTFSLIAILSDARCLSVNPYVRHPSLSLCVRSVTIATSIPYFTTIHELDVPSNDNESPEVLERRRAQFEISHDNAEKSYYEYLRLLSQSVTHMVNLKGFQWRDLTAMCPEFFELILGGNLKLTKVYFRPWSYPESFTIGINLTIKFLYFSITTRELGLNALLKTVLACKESLESLKIDGRMSLDYDPSDYTGFLDQCNIPNLKQFTASTLPLPVISVISKKNSSHIEKLELPRLDAELTTTLMECNFHNLKWLRIEDDIKGVSMKEFFQKILPKPSRLETLILGRYHCFKNVEIEGLLEILPELCPNLKNLWLYFEDTPSLDSITAITNNIYLEKLMLSATREMNVWRHGWLIEFEYICAICDTVSVLTKLEWMGFQNDTYEPIFGTTDYKNYYQERFSVGAEEDENGISEWDEAHLEFITGHATQFISICEPTKFLYLGQILWEEDYKKMMKRLGSLFLKKLIVATSIFRRFGRWKIFINE